MILVDTSVWVDHLRFKDEALVHLLVSNQVFTHPFVIGKLACGNLAGRGEILSRLKSLPAIPMATESEVLYFIEQNRLMGQGIGYVDAHLLAATAMTPPTRLWTRDKRLEAAASAMRLSYQIADR